jgi:DNA-binding transcriptional MerR regulator
MSQKRGIPSMAEAAYGLKDLVALAAAAEGMPLTERVARQYISDGLVPPALGTDGSMPFGEQHLLQLRLVMRLAAQYVPLREIQRYVDRLPAEGLRTLVNRPFPSRSPSEGDSQAYLTRLTRGLPPSLSAHGLFKDGIPKDGIPTPPRTPMSTARPRGLPNPPAAPATAQPQPPANAPHHTKLRSARSAWTRVVVDPDVELHVRTTHDVGQQRLVDALVTAVQEVLATERGAGL